MAGLRFGYAQDARQPRLIFLHATGFNARTYRALLEPLGECGPALALDLRGHGRSALPTTLRDYASWDIHCRDLLEVLDAHTPEPWVLAGHSMGATVALLAAAQRPGRVRALCLIEPVIFPPLFYMLARAPWAGLMRRNWGPMRKVRERRAHFDSMEAAAKRLTGRGVFAAFTPGTLRDYLGDGLRPAGDGLTLACEPAFEAATFAAQAHSPFAALRQARMPIQVLRAQRGSTFPRRAAEIVRRQRPDIDIETVADTGHMLPMEQPEIVRAALMKIVGSPVPGAESDFPVNQR